MAPTIIANRYRVDRAVGRGGMGAVWLCTDEVLGRAVAVKQVGHLPGESTPDLARALREARSAAALNHPNVVSIFDAIEDGDQIWLVMEYVPGRTLSEIMNEEGQLGPSRVAWIGAQIADGLAAAHLRGTMHRDVKPGNILVSDNDHAKISDFGIARTMGDSQLTQTGMVTGTPGYFSPQLARGEEPSPADDVWALGATLFAAVEGHPPFPEQSNALAMLSTIATTDAPRPERAGELTEAIVNMMQTDPAARWSMADVAYNLHRLPDPAAPTGTQEHAEVVDEQSSPTLIQPVPGPEPTPVVPPRAEMGTRHRRSLLIALVIVAAVIGAVVVWALLTGDPDETAAGDQPSERSSQDSTPDQSPPATPDQTKESTPDAPESTPVTDDGEEESTSISDDRAEQAVRDYYALLPEDTDAAWTLLSSEMQAEAGGPEGYESFWSGIDAVSVDDATALGGNAVEVTLTYTLPDGPDHENRRIELAERGDVIVIVDDGEPY